MKLDEIRKDFLYHNTDLYSLIEMFRDGHLGKSGRSTSLTRDRHYDNAPGSGVVGREVRLVFDRDELKNRYKLKPYADLSVTKDRFGDITVKGHEARWESEERVRGPISLNDVLRIEISPKAAKKLAQITKGHQEAIQHGKKRIEMLSKGYFWHNPRHEFVKIETERQKKHHVGSEPQIEKSIEDSRERIKLYKDISDSVVIVSEFNEEAAGVGKITKQNTTVDVKPGETARQAAKFGNKVDKNGRPPELHKKARKNSNAHVLTNLGMGEAVNIDNVNGRGAVPINQEVDYFGMRTKMRPSMFLKLAAPLASGPNDEMVDYIRQGGAIGAPFLIVDVPEDLNQDIPHVVGHEGRNRMKAVMKAEGDDPIEVHLFFRGAVNRARHLTKEIVNLLKAGAYQERTGRHVPGPLWEGKYPVAPHDEWYGDRQYRKQGAQMKMMSPDQYLSRVRPLQLDDESEENIKDLMNHIRSGRTLDPLKIYPDGKEDGRHRAYAAKRLGIKKVPVIIWPQKEITEAEQRIPVSQNYNQDRGNLDWIVIQIEKTIKELGDDLDVLVKTVNWDQLYATQDWLDNHGGGDPVFPDIPEDFWGYPVIASTGREFLIIDGHHRLNRDLADGEEAEGLVFDVRSNTKESEIRKPHPSQTLGIKRKDMPQVHRNHYPELIDYLAGHGNKFTNKEVHAHELKATQGEFSDKGVRKMMKTGGRPSDSRGKDKKPLIVSSDNYIIDGHHRWLAAWNQDDVVPVMKSSLPIKQLFQLIKDFRHTTYKDIHDSYTPLEVAIMEGGHSLEENMSITGTERQRSERDKKLTPGSEAWFRHWFSRPYLKREQLEQLKQEAVNHIKGARHEKATNRRRPNRNIRTNERRSTRRC
jgi:hypothetical protein